MHNERAEAKSPFVNLRTAIIALLILIAFNAAVTGATQIYRSVGVNSSVLASGSAANQLNITLYNAAFTQPLPLNVGVGDAIVYGGGSYIAFITGRTDAKTFTIQSASGMQPSATGNDQSWQVFRAYISLQNALAGNENPNIPFSVSNFDAWSGGNNITASNEAWNIACYADGADTATPADTTGWSTGASNYLRIYTPVSPAEVGVSQRHNGTYGTGYMLESSSGQALILGDQVSQVEGLAIRETNVTAGSKFMVYVNTGTMSGIDHKIYNCLLQGLNSTFNGNCGIMVQGSGFGAVFLWNDIIYGFNGTSADGINIADSSMNAYVYNCTLYGNSGGLASAAGSVLVKNTVAQANTNYDFNGAWGTGTDYNVSADSSAPGLNSKTNKTVAFANAAIGDFHLSLTDSSAHGAGEDLSTDPYIPFSSDIDGQPRVAPWDMGADQAPYLDIEIGIYGSEGDELNPNYISGKISRNSTNAADAVVWVQDTTLMNAPVSVPYSGGTYYAGGVAYVPGDQYAFFVTLDGVTYTAQVQAPGGVSVTADGLNLSNQFAGQSQTNVYVYTRPAMTNIYSNYLSGPSALPYAIPPSVYPTPTPGPDYYQVFVNPFTRAYGAFGNVLPTSFVFAGCEHRSDITLSFDDTT